MYGFQLPMVATPQDIGGRLSNLAGRIKGPPERVISGVDQIVSHLHNQVASDLNSQIGILQHGTQLAMDTLHQSAQAAHDAINDAAQSVIDEIRLGPPFLK